MEPTTADEIQVFKNKLPFRYLNGEILKNDSAEILVYTQKSEKIVIEVIPSLFTSYTTTILPEDSFNTFGTGVKFENIPDGLISLFEEVAESAECHIHMQFLNT